MTTTPTPPRSIKTLGTLNLVFAGLGLLGSAMTYAMYFGGLKLTPHDPIGDAVRSSPAYLSFLRASMVAGLISHCALAASGIGLHRMRSWGRKLALAYAVYAIVAAIGGIVMMVHYVMPVVANMKGPAGQAGIMGGIMGGLIAIAYPIVLIVFMSKRNIRDAFEQANEPPVPPAHVR
jgi:hypothetical protein